MQTKEEHYRSMILAVQRYAPNADMDLIERAYRYADGKHKDQLRKSGEPYIIHPLAVAEIVAEIGLDSDAIAAALLHDCLEDTDASFEEISRLFGETIAELVEGVTKLTRVQYSTMEEQQMENLRKMFMAMSKDIRVILIKIADRLHNTRTLQYQTPAKQISKSMETMEIYAPLAHRLGMQKIKWELEDVSLQYLDPDGYQQIIDYLEKNEKSATSFMNAIQSKITERLASVGIHGSIYGRVKHTYSIYRKMRAQNKTIDELYDLYAFRVIVDNIADCYNVLGHIHDLFSPIPGRFKDYISTPKPNMYQSLHTTVIGSQGIPFEVQIRTWEMHQTAEYGVAAHWKYKQHTGDGSEKEFEWVRRLLENQQDVDADDYIHSLKVDMFDDEVFVFTPKGKVISLPSGSTAIDFAYAIHSAVGNSMIGAKVNNRIASYDEPLHNGDIVEILTSKSAKGPSRDWLNICRSNQARIKIKQWFKKEKRDENIIRGKASFESELRRISVDPDILQNDDVRSAVLKRVSFESLDDMYAAIGFGGITAVKAVNRIKDELTKATRAQKEPQLQIKPPAAPASSNSGVIVEDIGSCMIKFSRCCTPVPGDDIIGFITKGYGVSIHRRDCPNAKQAADPSQSGRWVRVTWAEQPDALFSTSLELETKDRDGMMLDIATVLTSLRVRITEMTARSLPGGVGILNVSFPVHNLTELDNIRARLRGISGVVEVRRGSN
ncbi:MAG: bifunctional (p)ppGpp synthetase/guanosine-3',5'-bis(diphosphate) 3'-pyrophosphohydrolase [Oscillospiraceae bacterium]|jgi:guanosine-3',5'-bis(diphosphate) 3'-pyrophosphohydrolase|nr:bifunctional (p)ppGpp synthetase/guanosine-3',5'-bis(diphosphate) 3'-pyrophosphohydrolase [Oscillospiraceae bacterium]